MLLKTAPGDPIVLVCDVFLSCGKREQCDVIFFFIRCSGVLTSANASAV